ncbi:oxidoreductase-like domain-containing protein [Chitinivorax sp. PXF-14]|uniref:oxidoreductase-like domain-containing protein n=1 Tax=Chitinivorax sp. PXF-14 TaxID=3230488 RepID=UPI003466C20A
MTDLPTPPEPPEPPLDSDCCGSGCDVCVHDMYTAELTEYRRQLAEYQQQIQARAEAGTADPS